MSKVKMAIISALVILPISVVILILVLKDVNTETEQETTIIETTDSSYLMDINMDTDTGYDTNDFQLDTETTTLTDLYNEHRSYVESFGITSEEFNSVTWEFNSTDNMYSTLLYTNHGNFILKYYPDASKLDIIQGL